MPTTKKLRLRGTALVEHGPAGREGILVHADYEGNWLLPGGGLNRDPKTGKFIETQLAAAARELHEETGLEAYSLTFLFRHQSSFADHKVFFVLARGIPQIVDPHEAPALGICHKDFSITTIAAISGFSTANHRLMKGSASIIARYRSLRAERPGLFRALDAARLEPGEEKIELGALRGDWQTLPMPHRSVELDIQQQFSQAEMQAIRAGFISREMEDRWFCFYEQGTIFFHRSWTGACIFQASITPHQDGFLLSKALVNRNPEQYTSTDDAADAELLRSLIATLLFGQSQPTALQSDHETIETRPQAITTKPAPVWRELDRLTFTYRNLSRSIAIYQGDLTAMPPTEEVDLLVASALPNSYAPSRSSLIGALHRKGISLNKLAQRKALDLRPNLACWLSEELEAADPGIRFQRILCFESLQRGAVPEVVGDIFQCLISASESGIPVERVAMPLLAGGVHGVATPDMLIPLFDAASHWMQFGLPIRELKIVAYDELRAAELRGAFAVLKHQFAQRPPQEIPEKTYDLFISYCWKDQEAVDAFVAELYRQRPQLRIFLDRQILQTGCAWQSDIFTALDECRKIIAFYSPEYLTSKVCREEFNIALFRQRDEGGEVLLPIYLRSAALPTYMKLIQYIDCREDNRAALSLAAQQILQKL